MNITLETFLNSTIDSYINFAYSKDWDHITNRYIAATTKEAQKLLCIRNNPIQNIVNGKFIRFNDSGTFGDIVNAMCSEAASDSIILYFTSHTNLDNDCPGAATMLKAIADGATENIMITNKSATSGPIDSVAALRRTAVQEAEITNTYKHPRLIIISNSSEMPSSLSGIALNLGSIDDIKIAKSYSNGMNYRQARYTEHLLGVNTIKEQGMSQAVAQIRKSIFTSSGVVQDILDVEKSSDIGGYEKVKTYFGTVKKYIEKEKSPILKIKGSLFVGPAGTAKCVHSQSIVWYNGGIKRIGNMIEHVTNNTGTMMKITKPIEIIAKEDDKFTVAGVTHLLKSNVKSGLKISLEHGYEIKASEWHPLFSCIDNTFGWTKTYVLNEKLKNNTDIWIPIKIGHDYFTKKDFVKIPLKYMQIIKGGSSPIYKEVNKILTINKEIAYTLGALIGDGCLSNCKTKHNFGFTNYDSEVVKIIEKTINKLQGKFSSVSNTKYQFSVSSRIMAALIRYSGNACTSYTKGIPDFIIESPKKVLASFISGLFDTDGTVDKRGGYPSLTSTSEELIKDVQNCLLIFGIKSTISFSKNKFAGAWKIGITTDAELFFNEIGFLIKRKQNRKNNLPNKTNTNWGWFPSCIKEEMKQIIQKTYNTTPKMGRNKTPTNLKKSKKSKYKYWQDYIAGKRRPSKNKIIEFINIFGNADKFKKYMYNDVIWLKIISINKCAVDLYDLSVPGKSCFIANGLINHNSKVLSAIPDMLGLPGYFLDFNRASGSLHGQTERQLIEAIETAKKYAPVVIAIDEIEKAVAGTGEGEVAGNEVATKILGILLTAMSQDSNIYWVASANKVSHLPAPLLRRGRWDHLWYVGLPDETTRAKIFAIHCNKNDVDLTTVKESELNSVLEKMKDYTGAEIRHCIKEASIKGIAENKKVSVKDIIYETSLMKALVKDHKDTKQVQEWAINNANSVD